MSSLVSVASSALAAGRTGWTVPTASSIIIACTTACALAVTSMIERPLRRHRDAHAAGHAVVKCNGLRTELMDMGV